MNPKISDFGMARTFKPDELEANTNVIVGTLWVNNKPLHLWWLKSYFNLTITCAQFNHLWNEFLLCFWCSGYMSPEYVMEGVFSIKSDVYSFGVLMLEILSGRKNNSFYHVDYTLNLVGYVRQLNLSFGFYLYSLLCVLLIR